ncbi:MAG: hypothetical protein PHH54_05870 [Candidatus Nanoarchaeia archaeon]|nr:hypothetical protein [Candidatus Nanoarchaeia archaeon]MDD5741483.1 hypothetical protein [Candidatus Nanoarchaeia archaeon]
MSIETLVEFQKMIEKMKNPRERRASLDSFYARLKQSDLSEVQVEEIGRASELLEKYGFKPHSRKLMIKAGTAFLSSMDSRKLSEEDMYSALPYVNRISDQMETAGLVRLSDDLIDYFTRQIISMTPQLPKLGLPLSEPVDKAKAIASYAPEGYRKKSRFVVLPGMLGVPKEFELEGREVYAGYTRDGFMNIRSIKSRNKMGEAILGQPPEGIPDCVTYERLREHPLRGIMLITYSAPTGKK